MKVNKKVLLSLILLLVFLVPGCNNTNVDLNNKIDDNKVSDSIMSINVIINEEVYILNLETNKTVDAFLNLLPLEYTMNELNGNEKYVYFDASLPTDAFNPKTINKGDVYLYGDNCLVIFYKSFNTSYSYTKIGHIDNLPDLGSENIVIKFQK